MGFRPVTADRSHARGEDCEDWLIERSAWQLAARPVGEPGLQSRLVGLRGYSQC